MRRRKLYVAGSAIVVLAAVALVVGLDQFAWRVRWRDPTYVAALSAAAAVLAAVATVAAAIGGLVYVELTRRMLKQTGRQAETALMQSLMVEYDRLRGSIKNLRDEHVRLAPFSKGEKSFDPLYDNDRFVVSRFFVKIRKLAKKGLLTEDVIVAALDKSAVEEIFLRIVDALDQEVRKAARRAPETVDRDFYQALLRRYPAE